MKRVVTIAGSSALLASMFLVGNAVAARQQTHHQMTKTYTICTSTPVGVAALAQLSEGIQNGVNIAIKNLGSQLSKAGIKINQKNYDYASLTDPSNYDPNRAGTNGTDCAGLSNSLGMIGTLNSGAAEVEEPILNKDHMVMISPANTNPVLTSPGSRSSQEPCSSASGACSSKLPGDEVSYFRTVTTDKLQGPAGAEYAHSKLGATSYYLVTDGLTYGVGLATYFKQEAGSLGMSESGNAQIDTTNTATSSSTIAADVASKNPSIVYCGCDSETSNLFAYDLRQDGYHKPFVAGDAIVDNGAWLNSTTASTPGAGNGAVGTSGTTVGPATAAKLFTTLYKKYDKTFYNKYGIQPYDATSYDATEALINAIIKANKGGHLKGSIMSKRTAVVTAMKSTSFTGVTGKTTFDKDGDTTNKILTIYKVTGTYPSLSWVVDYEIKATGSPV